MCSLNINYITPPPPLAVKFIANLFIAHLYWGRGTGQTDRQTDIVVHGEVTLPKNMKLLLITEYFYLNICVSRGYMYSAGGCVPEKCTLVVVFYTCVHWWLCTMCALVAVYYVCSGGCVPDTCTLVVVYYV